MPSEIRELLQEALTRSAKSTALKPLAGLVAALLAGCVASSHWGVDEWLVRLLAILTCVTIAIFLAAYIYFALTNVDALRSEKFTIQKMALEKGFRGDDLTGYFKLKDKGGLPAIADASSATAQRGQE
jgi:phage shock protein PspC (stress-responsive transcriptional regulator)